MRLLRAADHVAMPWKNGGGETREIAVHPSGASLDVFGWRISMASVRTDGPFSMFPGVERTLCILDGDGMALTIGDAPPVILTRASAPLSFACDVPCNARLTGGPVLDLNVMTRRGQFRHGVSVLDVSGSCEIAAPVALFCGSGAVSIDRETNLQRHDCAFPQMDGSITIAGEGRLYVIAICEG